MSEAFLVRRGGLANAFAVIAVTYPAGSTCICTNGSKVLKAKDTSGSFLFMIPSAGTWTVQSTNGSQSASQNVSITGRYQSVNITLTYILWLYKDGDQVAGITGGWMNSALANQKMAFYPAYMGGQGNVFTVKAIDLTRFSRLVFVANCTAVPEVNQTMRMGLMGTSDLSRACLWEPASLSINCQIAAPAPSTSPQHYTLDISNIRGAYHVAFSYNTSNVQHTASFYGVVAS